MDVPPTHATAQAYPIDAIMGEVFAQLEQHTALVLHAPTGSGKTTRIPPALLARTGGRILLVQPRRIATQAAATFIAASLGEKPGATVGYRMRFGSEGGPHTRLWVLTTGVFLQQLIEDPFLHGTDLVILDEVHERSAQLDTALALLMQICTQARPDLHVLAMSATANVEALSTWFGGAPVLRTHTRTHPIEVHYAPFVSAEPLHKRAADAVRTALARHEGDILVFLPGLPEINALAEALGTLAEAHVCTLHARLSRQAQAQVLQPSAHRRVILSTNVAETSVTIPGVRVVIDSGLVRRARFDQGLGLDRLVTEPIAKASADQRAGRAGRTAPGVAIRLWTQMAHEKKPEADPPEIERVDLSAPWLCALSFGEPDPLSLAWPTPPSRTRAQAAIQSLQRLGALDTQGRLTTLGGQIASLPLPPRAARALVEGAKLGVTEPCALALALLTEPPALTRTHAPSHTSTGDLSDQIDALDRDGTQGWHALSPASVRAIHQVAQHLAQSARPLNSPAIPSHDALTRALCAGWPERVAKRRQPGSDRFLLATGQGATLHATSAVKHADWILALDLDTRGSEAIIRIAEAIDPESLPVHTHLTARYDAEADLVRVERLTTRGGVPDSATAIPDASQDVVFPVLIEAAHRFAHRWQPSNPQALELRTRLACARRARPDLPWPDTSDEAMLAALQSLAPRAKRLCDLAKLDWVSWWTAEIDWHTRAQLEQLAPEHLHLPNGLTRKLDYLPEGPPVLAVRMQDLFGVRTTPEVAGQPVRLHLLAPSGRVQQITDDLAGFWSHSWPEIRKELRGRYPKHAWPEDPIHASPPPRARTKH